MNPTRCLATAMTMVLACSVMQAAEETTNGLGGGDWSDPATWRGKKVPEPTDDVVIRKGDLVVFDRDDDGKVTCNKLQLDPRGALRFKTGAGKVVLCTSGPIEAYGPISLDASKGAKDHLELRMVGEDSAARTIKLQKGGALLARGKAVGAKGKPNVILSSPRVKEKAADVMLTLEATAGTSLDLQNVGAEHVHMRAFNIDSTGAKPGEKVNIVGCPFTGLGRMYCEKCDTPVIKRNSFGHPDPKRREGRAVFLNECPLGEVRDNVVTGGFDYGIASYQGADVAITGNTVEKCNWGVHLGFNSGQNVSGNTIRSCETGIDLLHVGLATLQENRVEDVKRVVRTLVSNAQFTNLQVDKLPKDAVVVFYDCDGQRPNGSLTLLNCNVQPEQVKVVKQAVKPENPPVTALDYLVVSIKKAPAEADVEVATEGFKGEADADLNVRNSPVPLGKGMTPLPQPAGAPVTISPIIVKSWVVDGEGKIVPAPKYRVRVLAPAEKPGAERKVLLTTTVQPGPTWFRAKPNAMTATVEAALK